MTPGFHRPSTVLTALELQASLGQDACLLAGGTELNQRHHPGRPAHLISLAGLDLGGVAASDDAVMVGATTTFQELLEAPAVPAPLRRAAAHLANRNVRNIATVGGQLAAGKSCGDLIPCLVALDARVMLATIEGSGAVAVADYVLAKPSGLIVAVEIPTRPGRRGTGLANFTRTANDLSVINAAASMERDAVGIQRPILALGGVAASVVRLLAVEQALLGAPLPARAQLEALVAAAVHPIDDLRGSATFKRHLASHLAADALTEAWQAAEE